MHPCFVHVTMTCIKRTYTTHIGIVIVYNELGIVLLIKLKYKMEWKWEETLNTHSCYPSSMIESRITERFKECDNFRMWPWAPEIEAMFLRARPTGSKPTRWNPDDKNQNWNRDIDAETRELEISLGKVEQGLLGFLTLLQPAKFGTEGN